MTLCVTCFQDMRLGSIKSMKEKDICSAARTDNLYAWTTAIFWLPLCTFIQILVADPLDYRWSSCQLYCNDDTPESFVDNSLVLKLLAENDFESKKNYRLLVEQGCDLGAGNLMEEEDAIERFCYNLSSVFAGIFKRAEKKKLVAAALGTEVLGLEELERRVEEIRKKGMERTPETRKAKKFLIEQLIARGFNRKEIAERLGVSRKTIYNILKSSG